MVVSCAMDLPHPGCLSHASLLATVIWVSGTTCYEPNYRPGCTMPATNTSLDIYPVYIPADRNSSVLRGEYIVSESGTVPRDAKTVYINATGGNVAVASSGVRVLPARPGVYLDTLTLEAPGPRVEDLFVDRIVVPPGTSPGPIALVNVTMLESLPILPSPQQHTIDLDGAIFENIRGGSVAMFRHTGTAVCSGTTRCFVMARADPGKRQGETVAVDGGTVVDVAAITGVFGAPYLVAFFGFNRQEELKQAAALANGLVVPTIIAIVSVLLPYGSKICRSGKAARALPDEKPAT